MHKLKLELDDLAIETFETERAGAAQGTVWAHDMDTVSCGSCIWSCGGSCGPPCATN